MPGEANVVSGLAGIASVPQPAGGAGGQGPDILSLVEAVGRIKAQQQQAAQGTLKTMLDIGEKYGIYPEEKEFQKTAKAAGVNYDGVAAIAQGRVTPQEVTKGGSTLAPKGGAQAATPPGRSAVTKSPGGGVQKTVPAGTGVVEQGVSGGLGGVAGVAPGPAAADALTTRLEPTPGPETNISPPQPFTPGPPEGVSPYQQMINDTRQKLADARMSEHMKSQVDQFISQVQMDIASPDPTVRMQATGRLLSLGKTHLTPEELVMVGGGPDKVENMLNVASGGESQALKEGRFSKMSTDLFQTGRFDTLADARRYAEGGQVNLKPDLNRTAKEAEIYNQMLEIGLSSKQAQDVARSVGNGASLSDALPKDFVPIAQQKLEYARLQAQAAVTGASEEQKRTQLAIEQAKLETARQARLLEVELSKTENEAFHQQFSSMIDMLRYSKGSVDPTYVQGMVNEAASRMRLIPELNDPGVIKSILNWLSFGNIYPETGQPYYTFRPGATSPSPGAAGAPQLGIPPTGAPRPRTPVEQKIKEGGVPPMRSADVQSIIPGISR